MVVFEALKGKLKITIKGGCERKKERTLSVMCQETEYQKFSILHLINQSFLSLVQQYY